MTLISRLVLSLGLLSSPVLADSARQIATAGAWTVVETRDEKSNLRSYVAVATAETGGDTVQVSCRPPSPLKAARLLRRRDALSGRYQGTLPPRRAHGSWTPLTATGREQSLTPWSLPSYHLRKPLGLEPQNLHHLAEVLRLGTIGPVNGPSRPDPFQALRRARASAGAAMHAAAAIRHGWLPASTAGSGASAASG